MMKPKIRVFPDYCSSGLWDDRGNLDADKFESVLGKSNLIALRYLHDIWEFMIACCCDEQPRVGDEYIREWRKDWEALVDQFNLCQDKFEFVSCV